MLLERVQHMHYKGLLLHLIFHISFRVFLQVANWILVVRTLVTLLLDIWKLGIWDFTTLVMILTYIVFVIWFKKIFMALPTHSPYMLLSCVWMVDSKWMLLEILQDYVLTKNKFQFLFGLVVFRCQQFF